MNLVEVRKPAWCPQILDWLKAQVIAGEYGFNVESLGPDYEHFEYWFTYGEDALAFKLTFSDITV
jgi:hypothetical protein